MVIEKVFPKKASDSFKFLAFLQHWHPLSRQRDRDRLSLMMDARLAIACQASSSSRRLAATTRWLFFSYFFFAFFWHGRVVAPTILFASLLWPGCMDVCFIYKVG